MRAHEPLHGPGGQIAVSSRKQWIVRAPRGKRRLIRLQGPPGRLADRDASLLVAFPPNRHDSFSHFPILTTQPGQFRNAKAGSVEKLENGAVSQPFAKFVPRRAIEKVGEVLFLDRCRKFSWEPGPPQLGTEHETVHAPPFQIAAKG